MRYTPVKILMTNKNQMDIFKKMLYALNRLKKEQNYVLSVRRSCTMIVCGA
jgi:succinate dehydrogenase/fumarate reductase-like Fe-S protein